MARGSFRVLGTPMFFGLTSCVRPDEGPGQRRAEGFPIGQAITILVSSAYLPFIVINFITLFDDPSHFFQVLFRESPSKFQNMARV